MARPPATGWSGDGSECAFKATVVTMTARRASNTINVVAWLALKTPGSVVGGGLAVGLVVVVATAAATARFHLAAIQDLNTADQKMPPRQPPAMIAGAVGTPRANCGKTIPGQEEARDMPVPRRTPPRMLPSRKEVEEELRRIPADDHDRGLGTVCPN